MFSNRIFAFFAVCMIVFAAVATITTGEPSKNNPRRQDAYWEEEDVRYDITYLANGNVTVIIEPPDIYDFEGTGTVVMWWTIWVEGEDVPTQEHKVLKIVDGEIVKEHTNEISENASLNVTNNPSPINDTDQRDSRKRPAK